MNITDYLNDDTLIICPSEVKMAALRYLNESRLIRTVKFMNMEEYRRNYFFDYDENAILAICRMESCKPAIARMYLDNLCYVEDRDYGNENLNRLVDIKKDLQQKEQVICEYDYLPYNLYNMQLKCMIQEKD